MVSDKSNIKDNRFNIVWGEYEEMIKQDPTKKIPPDWVIFGKIQHRDEKRRRRYILLSNFWWILFGSGIIISLASTLAILHENIFPIEKPDTLWKSVFAIIFFLYFFIAIVSVAGLLDNKKKNNEKFREEVYSFFQRYYDEAVLEIKKENIEKYREEANSLVQRCNDQADSRYKDWKIKHIKDFLYIT